MSWPEADQLFKDFSQVKGPVPEERLRIFGETARRFWPRITAWLTDLETATGEKAKHTIFCYPSPKYTGLPNWKEFPTPAGNRYSETSLNTRFPVLAFESRFPGPEQSVAVKLGMFPQAHLDQDQTAVAEYVFALVSPKRRLIEAAYGNANPPFAALYPLGITIGGVRRNHEDILIFPGQLRPLLDHLTRPLTAIINGQLLPGPDFRFLPTEVDAYSREFIIPTDSVRFQQII